MWPSGVTYAKYMNLYTVAYNYCVSSRMHGNLDASVGLGGRSKWLRCLSLEMVLKADMPPDPTTAGANLMGSDLYNNLMRYFIGHLKGLREVRLNFHDF